MSEKRKMLLKCWNRFSWHLYFPKMACIKKAQVAFVMQIHFGRKRKMLRRFQARWNLWEEWGFVSTYHIVVNNKHGYYYIFNHFGGATNWDVPLTKGYFIEGLLSSLGPFWGGLKMTQINFVSRNQLHNTANSCQHLNFGLSWPG